MHSGLRRRLHACIGPLNAIEYRTAPSSMPFDIVFVHVLCIVDSHRPITIGVMGDPQTSIVPVNGERPNGEVVIGDMDHDGRVILYIIKGPYSLHGYPCPAPDPIYSRRDFLHQLHQALDPRRRA